MEYILLFRNSSHHSLLLLACPVGHLLLLLLFLLKSTTCNYFNYKAANQQPKIIAQQIFRKQKKRMENEKFQKKMKNL